MDTIYNRHIWKKRSLFGYSPEAIRQEINEMQEEHSIMTEDLLAKLEKRKKHYNELSAYLEELKKQFKEQGPVEEELTQSLLEKLLATTTGLEMLKEDHLREMNRLESQLKKKQAERAHLVEQLKETLQQLHTTFTNLGGMHRE